MHKKTIALILAGILLTFTMCACMSKRKAAHSPATSLPTSVTATGEKESANDPQSVTEQTETTTANVGTTATAPIVVQEQEVSGDLFEAEPPQPPATTAPTPTETLPPTTPSGPVKLTYEEFLALSDKDQEAYFYQYADPADYLAWLENAMAEYEATRSTIVAEGDVNIGGTP